MALADLNVPMRSRQNLSEMGIDRNKYYYIAFFNNGKLDTRPIKVISAFTVYSSVRSDYLMTEAEFTYDFETEKSITQKVMDSNFWGRLFGNKEKLIQKKVTEKWKIDFTEEWDTIDFYLIGETPDLAKLKLIMAALKTPHPSKEKSDIINKEMEYFQEYEPELVMKAMDFRIDTQYGDITDYSDKFLKIEGDLRND